MNQNLHSDFISGESTNFGLKATLLRYLGAWPWYILAVIITLTTAWLYLRYIALPIYEVNSTVLIREGKKGSLAEELAAFSDLGLVTSASNTLENEIETLKSRSLMTEVVKALRLNVQYFLKGTVKEGEHYNNGGIFLRTIDGDSILYNTSLTLRIIIRSESSYDMVAEDGEIIQSYLFGEPINFSFGDLVIESKRAVANYINEQLAIVIRPVDNVVGRYQNALRINQSGRSGILKLTFNDTNHNRALDVLNELVSQYNVGDLLDKTQVAERTSAFIDERMRIITSELNDVESSASTFKEDNRLVDVSSQAALFVASDNENRQAILEINLQLRLVE